MSPSECERELAGFASRLELADVPDAAVERATTAVADTIGAIVGGSTDSSVPNLAASDASRYHGSVSVLGTELATTTDRATAINGMAGTVLEFDEDHKRSAGHPAIHVLPAVIAEAEADGGTGEAFLESFVVGYEVAARTGIACSPLRQIYHMHGVWPIVDGAAAVARYRGLDTWKTLHAMRIAANGALHTVFDAATEGATERNTYAGTANADAIRAVDRAEAGFTGVEAGVRRHLERTCEGEFDSAALADGFRTRWEVERGYVKKHAACRYTHRALDAIDAIEREHEIDLETVDSIRVETYPSAARLTEPRPTNALQAKFSIPFAVATRLVCGHSGKRAFEPEQFDESTYELAEVITVTSAEDLAARVPEARGTRVTIRLVDGTTVREAIRHPRGDEHNPFTRAEIREKLVPSQTRLEFASGSVN